MSDKATPNLPSRDFDATARFYEALSFTMSWRSSGWMILNRGGLTVEFFPYPDLNPLESAFGCCFRVDDVEAFYKVCKDAGVPETATGQPRLRAPRREAWGGTVGFLVDPDGTLIRLVQAPAT